MKNILLMLLFGTFLLSCNEVEEEKKPDLSNENLIETIDGIYYDYYPGKKQVKITGPVDDKNERNGRWELYNENGRLMGFTMYVHGKKHGHSFTSYPDGTPQYHGEYWQDTMIGVWKTYDIKGTVNEKDYGLPEGY
jgi:antitoxin component YwqK of YwqJK toxin-antitoxin module